MLDPRIYRTGMVVVALAFIVFAFSLENQPAGYGTTLAPDAFNGQNAFATMNALAGAAPARPPGSPGDEYVAGYVARTLGHLGFTVSSSRFSARTIHGRRTLENVTGVLAGSSNSTIVLVAHRDALGSPATADLSGTAVMLEVARLLTGATERHTIVVASTSGSAGAAGAARLAREVQGPVDAVLALGDLAAVHPRPAVVPWSTRHTLSPPALANTVAGALAGQAQLRASRASLGGQLLHLAFPMTLTEQAPFLDSGAPAVLLSLSGEQAPSGVQPASAAQLTASGRAVLQSVGALDGGAQLSAPSAYLVYAGKIIPGWSIRLLVLALILPVALTTVDGVARARRRRIAVLPWCAWVLACALAFALAAGVVTAMRVLGVLSGAPAGPVASAAAAPHTAGAATIIAAALVLAAALALLAPRVSGLARAAHVRREPAVPRARSDAAGPTAGAGIAVAVVLVAASLVMWASDPFAAILLVPALHLWMWLAAGTLSLPRAVKLPLALLGALAPALAVLYYAVTLKLSALAVLWNGVLMIAGGQIGPLAIALWSAVLGCFAGVIVLALRPSHGRREEPVAVTVRGPLSYAGPGSLGGTSSALRR